MGLFLPGRTRTAAVLSSLAMAVLPAAIFWLSFDYRPSVRAVPQLICTTMLVLIALDLIGQTDTVLGRAVTAMFGREDEAGQHGSFEGAGFAMLWVPAFVGLVLLIGFLPTALVYTVVSMTVFGTSRLPVALVWGCGLALIVWLFFEVALGFTLYRGLLVAPLLDLL
jgi:hypothetical protein